MGHDGDEPREARFEISASALGLTPPPVALRLTPELSPEGLRMFVQHARGRVGPVIEWLEPWAPQRIDFGPEDVLRADFPGTPHEWRWVPRELSVESVALSPEGGAVVSVRGRRLAVRRLLERLRGDAASPSGAHRVAAILPPIRLLTRPQEEALRVAVQAGYYRVPRALNLRALARELGIGAAALSERLRRAEGRVITRFVTEAMGPP